MRVIVKLFAAARELAGQGEIELELAADVDANIGALRAALLADYPALGPLLPHAMFAIDTHYATDETTVTEGSEIACIPPVSGG